MGGLPALGTKLQMETAPSTYTTIAQVVKISGPKFALDTADTTCLDSPGGWEEVVGTVLRSGEITLDINYVPSDATHDATAGLLSKMQSKAVVGFKLQFPDTPPTEWTFQALVTGFQPEAAADGKLTASVTLKITGQPTLA